MAGQQTLNLYVVVRLHCPQPELYERTVMELAVLLVNSRFMIRSGMAYHARQRNINVEGASPLRTVNPLVGMGFSPSTMFGISKRQWWETCRSTSWHGGDSGENKVNFLDVGNTGKNRGNLILFERL